MLPTQSRQQECCFYYELLVVPFEGIEEDNETIVVDQLVEAFVIVPDDTCEKRACI